MRQNRPCLRRIGALEGEALLAGVGHSPAEAKGGGSVGAAESGRTSACWDPVAEVYSDVGKGPIRRHGAGVTGREMNGCADRHSTLV